MQPNHQAKPGTWKNNCTCCFLQMNLSTLYIEPEACAKWTAMNYLSLKNVTLFMFIHVPIPCKGKGTNLQSRAAQVHSALFPRGAVLVLRVSKSGVVSALSKVPATSMVLVCSCPFPPCEEIFGQLDHSVMFLVWVRFFWRSCTKNNLQTEAQNTFIYSIHFFFGPSNSTSSFGLIS